LKILNFKYKLAIWLLDLFSITWRIELIGEFPKTPSVIAFWHGTMMPVWRFFRNRKFCGVVSLSRDGEILSQLLEKWGYSLARGSSSKHGNEVLNIIVNQLENSSVMLTPDGPRGPAKMFKAGAAVAAMRSNKPLYLVKPEFSFNYVFKRSWDNFSLPLPFAKIKLIISNTNYIDNNSTREEVDRQIISFSKFLN